MISKEAKEKAQVEKPREEENVRTEESLGVERREKSLLIDIEIELGSRD